VAASVPDAWIVWIDENLAPLRERWQEARWIPSENQHVTLKFLGSTEEGLVADVAGACRELAASYAPSPLGLDGLGVFPSRKRARVLWLGVGDPDRLLASLAAGLDERLGPLGFARETRTFSAHLTVARFRTPQSVGQLPDLPPAPPAFSLAGFELWRSHLSPGGARYERLASFPLGI
jgi:2'-5' RNA ligase